MGELLKLIMHFYTGSIEENRFAQLSNELLNIDASWMLSQDPSKVCPSCDEELKKQYLEGWQCCIQGHFQVTNDYGLLDKKARFDMDVFKEGIGVLVVSLSVSGRKQRKLSPEKIYQTFQQIIDQLYDNVAYFLPILRTLRNCVERFTIKDPELEKIDQSVGGVVGLGFAYSIVIVDGQDLTLNKPEILLLLLSPDYTGKSRVPYHLQANDYLAEIFGEMKVYASWENFVIQGHVYEDQVPNYDLLNRLLLRVWYNCYLIDELTATFLSNIRQMESSTTTVEEQARHIESFFNKLKDLRRRYTYTKNYLLKFDPKMSMRFINLLKYSMLYSNLTSFLDSTQEKLDVLYEDYSHELQSLEQRRSERINTSLQTLAIVVAAFGIVQAIDILLDTLALSKILDIRWEIRFILEILPLLLTILWFAWARDRK